MPIANLSQISGSEGLTSHFDEKTSLCSWLWRLFRTKGFLNKYIRYDTVFIAMQYLGMAIRGIPYMGVGRNLAYRKDEFFKNKGFGSSQSASFR